jgi:hypothetical protein
MSNVTPPAPTSQLPPPQVLPTATVTLPPPDLAQLALGAKLDALILTMTSKGLVEVDTNLGKLQLQTGFPLQKGAPLQLQLISKGNQFQFLITAIGGKPPSLVSRTSTAGLTGSPGSSAQSGNAAPGTAAQATNPAPVSLLTGTKTTVTLLRTAATGNAGTSSQTGTSTSTASIAGVATSPKSTTSAAGKSSAGHSQSSPTNTTNKSAQSSTIQSGSLSGTQPGLKVPAGSRFSAQITSVIPANQMRNGGGIPNAGPTSFSAGQIMTGVVVGKTNSHHPIINTHAGPVSIITPSALPPGTTISFQILAAAPNSTSLSEHAVIERAGTVILETKGWPVLDETVDILNQTTPSIAQQLINSALPRPDSALTANILFFIAALRGSEIKNWLGDAPIRALERIRPNLASRLGDEFQQIAKLSDDDAGKDWRAIPIPMLNGSEIEQIRLFMRRKPRKEDDSPETRFIIDMDLSNMGRIQMDGLIVQEKKKFDLIVRLERQLTPSQENDIREIFVKSSELTGVSGGLTFRTSPPDFTEITVNSANDTGLGLIV